MKIKEEYGKLKEKYNLPDFKRIDDEFEISAIDREEFLLREVRRKIDEKIELYLKFLENILQPDTGSLSSIYEYRFFNDEERQDIFELFKNLIFFDRLSIETSIGENDKKTSKFINDFLKDWPEMKSKFLVIVKNAKEGWLKDTKIIDEERRYLG